MADNLSAIFGPYVRPTLPGVYQVKVNNHRERMFPWRYSYWNGRFWAGQHDTIEQAEANKDRRGNQMKIWRGLCAPA